MLVILLGLGIAVFVVLSRSGSRKDGITTDAAHGESAIDTRTPIPLDLGIRIAILAEMRTMLSSVQGVLDGTSRSDSAAIRKAATAAGMVMAVDPQLEKVLPREFLQFGMTTHRAFDSLAANVSAGPDDAIKRLAAITATCVECHAAYRLEVK